MHGAPKKALGYLLQQKLTDAILSKDSIVVNGKKVFDSEHKLQIVDYKNKIDKVFEIYSKSFKDRLMELNNKFSYDRFDTILNESIHMDSQYIFLDAFDMENFYSATQVNLDHTLQVNVIHTTDFLKFFKEYGVNQYKLDDFKEFLVQHKIFVPLICNHTPPKDSDIKPFYSIAIQLQGFIL